MATRIQVVLGEEEREKFRRQAENEGLSLSAWLRRAGRERLAAQQRRRITTTRELKAFFKTGDKREQGREPDWAQHREVIKRSQASGTPGT
jgi:hypothetical protein